MRSMLTTVGTLVLGMAVGWFGSTPTRSAGATSASPASRSEAPSASGGVVQAPPTAPPASSTVACAPSEEIRTLETQIETLEQDLRYAYSIGGATRPLTTPEGTVAAFDPVGLDPVLDNVEEACADEGVVARHDCSEFPCLLVIAFDPERHDWPLMEPDAACLEGIEAHYYSSYDRDGRQTTLRLAPEGWPGAGDALGWRLRKGTRLNRLGQSVTAAWEASDR